MPDDGVRGGRAATGLLSGVPLRVRLVAVACCLVAVGAGLITLACGLAARDSLMRQADQELRTYAGFLASRPFTVTPAGSGPGGAAGSAFLIEVVSAGQLVMRAGPGPRPGPALARIPVRAGRLVTVPARSGGGSWLVITEPVHYSARRILFTYGYDGFSLHITSPARPGTAGTLVAGLDLASADQGIRKITVSCAAVGGAAILTVTFLGLAVIRVILRPLAQAEKLAADVAAHGLSRQAPDDPRGPADSRTRSPDTMPSVLDGICRELRRPVSIIRGITDYYRQRGPLTARELDRMMSRVADEAARMHALINELASAGHDQARLPGKRRQDEQP